MRISKFASAPHYVLKLLPLAACGLALANTLSAGFVSQGVDPLYSFTGGHDGANPAAPLVQASDGSLYGTTANGGIYGNGTVFRIAPNGTITPLYSFVGGSDGGNPYAGLIQAGDGSLYGTTEIGGTDGYGEIFRISTNGSFTPLYSFTGGNDGANPVAALIQTQDGSLYGTTENGGTNGVGAIFRISTNGTFTSVHSFSNSSGANPAAALIQAGDGSLYGATGGGGTNYAGTIFQITTNGVFTSVYSFTGGNDGGYPTASLLQASDGSLYGTTENGGTNGAGTIFQITTNGVFTSLYSFTGRDDGANPAASLIQTADGYLYGTTSAGGINGWGAVFRATTDGRLTTLCSFTGTQTPQQPGSEGATPQASLIRASDGNFYGTANQGGAAGNGTVFVLDALQLAPRSLLFTALAGGPIAATNLTIINLGAASLNWSLANNPWLNFSPSGGPLAPGASLPVTVSTTPASASRQPGIYFIALDLTNLSDGLVQSMQVNYEAILSPLASFPGCDGANPYAPLIQAGDGNFYGTTANGGFYGSGEVFRITTNGAITALYSFTSGNDGANAYAGLIQAGNGYFYGTAEYGGAYGNGTVFQISTNGALTSLHSFTGADDGGNPQAGLIQAGDGNLYGTAAGGTSYGTIFRITTNGAFAVVHSFTGGDDGATPAAALLQASDGYLYGTTVNGGFYNNGAVFRITLDGAVTPLYSFTGGDDGGNSYAALIQARDGYLYGTTQNGGTNGSGTVFQISTNGSFIPLAYFTGGNDGANPSAALIQARDDFLYGTTQFGGSNGYGTVFQISTGGSVAPLYSFTNGTDGANPVASLIQTSDGYLYGTTGDAGLHGDGTIFKITTQGALTALYSFTGTGQVIPSGALQISGGNFYGTTEYGGTNGNGMVFQIGANGSFTPLYSFTGRADGARPDSGLLLAGDGYFYGTASGGGTNNYGTIFQISTNGSFTLLYSFTNGTDGADPGACLIQASNGSLYGTTWYGGSNGFGTVFRISTNGAFTPLYSFTNGTDGYHPSASLTQAGDGYLYGTTLYGGSNIYRGTVFRISTNGAFTSLYSFGYQDGASPLAALLQASDGSLYGTTWGGGAYGWGTVFRMSTQGAFTSLYSFTGANDGANPAASLVQAANGDLYGTTTAGGDSGFGTVFQITLEGAFTSLYSFSGGSDGGNPGGSLVAFDGYLQGMTLVGGANGNGTVFQFLIPASGVLPVTIGRPSLSGGNLIFSFPTTASQSYTVQQNVNLAPANWLIYTNFSGNGLPVQLVVPAAKLPAAFFRVTEP